MNMSPRFSQTNGGMHGEKEGQENKIKNTSLASKFCQNSGNSGSPVRVITAILGRRFVYVVQLKGRGFTFPSAKDGVYRY